MEKVYIIYHIDDETTNVHSVWRNKENAKKKADKLQDEAAEQYLDDVYIVQGFELSD